MSFRLMTAVLVTALPMALADGARADWRESILGNRIHGEPAAKTKPSKGTKTASLGNSGWSLFSSSGSSSSEKKKSKSSSAPSSWSLFEGGGFSSGPTYSGQASYYWQPQKLASGGTFDPSAMTAAHKTLPFGTKVRVTNELNGKSVVVTINDRGPYVAGRVIDLSAGAAGVISMKNAGVVPVKVAVLGK